MAEKNYGNKEQLIDILNSMKFPIMGAGGGFAPIGTESYFEGTTAPQGWILCDGSVLNIADYPELATYYASHYGASNHFGGDGVTTFAVPIKEGMPQNTDSVYGEQERVIGVWKETVDGVLKQKPVYEKTFFFSSTFTVFNNSWTETQIDATSYDRIIAGTGINFVGSIFPLMIAVNSNVIRLVTGRNEAVVEINGLMIQYTKTTDSWTLPTLGHSADGNGVFCIKATVSGDANAHVYSTEEQVVGTWIDGKDLYEKTIPFYNITLSSTNQSNIGDISDIPIDFGWVHQVAGEESDGGYFESIGYINAWIRKPANNFGVKLSSNTSAITYSKLYITIQYTKTSD